MFAYCGNNPIARSDTTGNAWETIFDILTLGFSIAEVAANPYDPMAWIGLAGDLVDIVPFVTGVGETVRGLRFADEVGNVLEIAENTDDAIDTYRSLRNLNKGTGNEVHHIIEKRFSKALDIDNTNDMLSIALTKSDHRVYTNAWRAELPYGSTYSSFEVFKASVNVYGHDPQLMGAAVETLFR